MILTDREIQIALLDLKVAPETREAVAPRKWPTLGDRVKTWEGTRDRCGEEYPADTMILAVLSPTEFCISCECSPRSWVVMVAR
jgi:hypothetical protein